jgi:transposase-like protein
VAKSRKRHSAQYKFKLALEAAKEQQTINELASRYRVHPNQISQWKRLLIEGGPDLFNGHRLTRQHKAQQAKGSTLPG